MLHLLQLCLVVLVLLGSCECASTTKPHHHKGKVAQFSPGKPSVKLDSRALMVLESGKPYSTQVKSGNSGRGMVVQDVAAPQDVVWGRILDFDNYSKMVPRTSYSKNYKVEGSARSTRTIFTHMKLSVVVTKIEFFIRHKYYPSKNSLVWTLDYNRASDLDDSCGFWYTEAHPTKPGWTRLYYSVEVAVFDWVPGVVMDILSKKALTEATGWVKRYSESEAERVGAVPGSGEGGGQKERRGPFAWIGRVLGRKDERREDGGPSTTPGSEGPDNSTLARRWTVAIAIVALITLNVLLNFENRYAGKR